MIPVVLDTNVLGSALIVPLGKPARILSQLAELQLITTEEILAEVNRALHYPRVQRKYNLGEEIIEAYLERLRNASLLVTPTTRVTASRDPDDNKFLACAKEGEASYVVSGDPHLVELGIWEGIPILTPAAFLDVLSPLPPL